MESYLRQVCHSHAQKLFENVHIDVFRKHLCAVNSNTDRVVKNTLNTSLLKILSKVKLCDIDVCSDNTRNISLVRIGIHHSGLVSGAHNKYFSSRFQTEYKQ